MSDIDCNSVWSNGFPWMSLEESEFPCIKVHELNLNVTELSEVKKECAFDMNYPIFVLRHIPDDVKLRYEFSKYMIDPNKFRFQKVVLNENNHGSG